jgi:dolichol-phosphate mannosyltransferase
LKTNKIEGVDLQTTAAGNEEIELTILVPVKDEAESIPELAGEIEKACLNIESAWECLWIDDGSEDLTQKILKETTQKHKNHFFLILDQNYGQSAALYAGIQQSRGRLIVTLDGDGQNDPADIPALLERQQKKDADMVNGMRTKRQDSKIRKFSSRTANSFRNLVTGESISDVGCSLRIFKRECLNGVFLFKGMHRFIPTLARINGFENIEEIPVGHRPRERGKTKYGIKNRLWVGLIDTLAVSWMKWRRVMPRIKKTNCPQYQADQLR